MKPSPPHVAQRVVFRPKQPVHLSWTDLPKMSLVLKTCPDPPQIWHAERPEPWQRWHRRFAGFGGGFLRAIGLLMELSAGQSVKKSISSEHMEAFLSPAEDIAGQIVSKEDDRKKISRLTIPQR